MDEPRRKLDDAETGGTWIHLLRAFPPKWRRRIYISAMVASAVGAFAAAAIGPLVHWVRAKTNETVETTERRVKEAGADYERRFDDLQDQIDSLPDALRLDDIRQKMRDIDRDLTRLQRTIDNYDEINASRKDEIIRRLDEIQKKRR